MWMCWRGVWRSVWRPSQVGTTTRAHIYMYMYMCDHDVAHREHVNSRMWSTPPAYSHMSCRILTVLTHL